MRNKTRECLSSSHSLPAAYFHTVRKALPANWLARIQWRIRTYIHIHVYQNLSRKKPAYAQTYRLKLINIFHNWNLVYFFREYKQNRVRFTDSLPFFYIQFIPHKHTHMYSFRLNYHVCLCAIICGIHIWPLSKKINFRPPQKSFARYYLARKKSSFITSGGIGMLCYRLLMKREFMVVMLMWCCDRAEPELVDWDKCEY